MCRPRAWPSSNRLWSFSPLQMAFHSSYWVTESRPERGHERRVVAVDHLPDEVRPGMPGPDPGHHLGPERGGHGVGRVQPPAVRARVQPVVHHPRDIVGHGRLVVVERHQGLVALERAVLRLRARLPVRRPGQPEPRGLGRIRALFQHPLEGREAAAHVVEDPVEQHPQPARVRGLHQASEVPLIPEPGVDPVVVGGVVSVRLRGEDRPERDPRGTQVHGVVQPAGQLPEPVRDRPRAVPVRVMGGSRLRFAGGLRGGKAKRVDLPPDGVLDPVRHALLLSTRQAGHATPAARRAACAGRGRVPGPGRAPWWQPRVRYRA